MTEYLARSFQLLAVLQASTAVIPAAELARRLGVNTRSVRRLVAGLREIGFGIESAPGRYGGYRLGVGRRIAPLLPTEPEVIALLAGLSSSAVTSMEDIGLDRDLLVAKLLKLLPDKHQLAISDLTTYVSAYQTAGPQTPTQVVRDVTKYCRLRLEIEAAYRVQGAAPSSLILEPHCLVQNDYLWYLVAWNSRESSWETLRLDRIESYAPTSRRFVQRDLPAKDLAPYTANAIATAPYAYRVEALFTAPAAEVATRFPIDAVFVQPVDEDSCIVHTGADTYETVAVYLVSANLPFTILSPPEMREKMLETAATLREAASSFLDEGQAQ